MEKYHNGSRGSVLETERNVADSMQDGKVVASLVTLHGVGEG